MLIGGRGSCIDLPTDMLQIKELKIDEVSLYSVKQTAHWFRPQKV